MSTVPLKTRDDAEVQVSAVRVPAQVRQGQPFNVEVVIDANHDDDGEVEIYQGAHKVWAQRRKLKKGENRILLPQSIEQDRLVAFTARTKGFEAGGGTVMYPAREEAYEALQHTVAKLKHVIILIDDISAPGDFEGLSQSMASARITVSTVGVGGDADQALLEEIARNGGGRSYQVEDPFAIPQIFAKETVAASKLAINEQPFQPQTIRPTLALAALEVETAPPLLGFVLTRNKPTSEPLLASESGDPLLTWWRYGLGMSVAFTSDAKNRWAAWPSFGKFWAQVVRHAMRKNEAKGIVVQVEQKYQGKPLYQQSRGLAVGYPDELRLRPTNQELLRSIARAAGGLYNPRPEAVFAPTEQTALRATPLWPYLLMAAALLFVLDVGLRRIDLTLLDIGRRLEFALSAGRR